MTEDLKMPGPEEGAEEEIRMVVMNLGLPKAIWWALDRSEQISGLSTSDELSKMLRQQLLVFFLQTMIVGR